MKKTIAILLVTLMALSFVACASKKDAEKKESADTIVGTWELDFDAMMSQLSEEERALMETFGMTADSYSGSYTFNADGTGHASISMMGQTESADFTYKTEGDKLTIIATYEGETSTTTGNYKIEGSKLTMTSDAGESMVFNRK